MRDLHFRAFLAATFLAAAGGACVDQTDDAETVAAAIEQEYGGLDMEDEAPMFGVDDEFAAAAVEPSARFADPLAEDTEMTAMSLETDAVVGEVLLMWGQLPPDRAPEGYARDWSGRLSLNRGGLIVRRTINFEPATDRVLERTERTAVAFASVTRPFVDGMLVRVIDPEPGAGPLTLTYERDEGGTLSLELPRLLEGPVVVDLDDQGNRIAAIAIRRGDDCDHGFGRGRWRSLRDNLGGMLGEISNDEGEVIGHIRGVWGERRNGEQVFFGKYIGVDGGFRGLFGGHYRDGHMVGRWIIGAGDYGRFEGRYVESAPGAEVGGHFALRWAETSCAQDLPTDGE